MNKQRMLHILQDNELSRPPPPKINARRRGQRAQAGAVPNEKKLKRRDQIQRVYSAWFPVLWVCPFFPRGKGTTRKDILGTIRKI